MTAGPATDDADLPPGTHEEFGLRFPDGEVRYIGRDSAAQLAAHPEWGATLVRRTTVVASWANDMAANLGEPEPMEDESLVDALDRALSLMGPHDRPSIGDRLIAYSVVRNVRKALDTGGIRCGKGHYTAYLDVVGDPNSPRWRCSHCVRADLDHPEETP